MSEPFYDPIGGHGTDEEGGWQDDVLLVVTFPACAAEEEKEDSDEGELAKFDPEVETEEGDKKVVGGEFEAIERAGKAHAVEEPEGGNEDIAECALFTEPDVFEADPENGGGDSDLDNLNRGLDDAVGGEG